MQVSFSADPGVAATAEAYTLDAIDFGARMGVALDGSDESIRHVEQILDTLHLEAQRVRPTPDQILLFAKMLGSYIGEVYRRNHGAEWGWVEMDGQPYPGLQKTGGGLFWPWSKAEQRIVNGAEDNVWNYYCVLSERRL